LYPRAFGSVIATKGWAFARCRLFASPGEEHFLKSLVSASATFNGVQIWGSLPSIAGAVPAKGGAGIGYLMRVVLLNLGSASLEAANAALAGEGYEITIANALTFEEVLALTPRVLITEATPSDLSCCGVITLLKSRPETASLLKVLMIVEGGAFERARALDLGTDDVISFPFDAVEFAAKIRLSSENVSPDKNSTACSSTCGKSGTPISQPKHYAAAQSVSAVSGRCPYFLPLAPWLFLQPC